MATSFLINVTEDEFKIFLRQVLSEILGEQNANPGPTLPDILDVKQAAEFLHLKITTIYEKTSEKTIPHFKKGNKLYFRKAELKAWVETGKVKTNEEIQGEAVTYILNKSST